jgi:hypothetical protein
MSLRKRIAYALAPLIILFLIDMVPVSHAQDIIPEKSTVALADTVAPSDVNNLKAVAGDASVTLSWDVATDNVGVKGYKLYFGTKSVTTDGGSYENGPIDMGNKINYTVNGLTNGTPYFFVVTAYDAAGNESTDYSVEASATPLHGSAAAQSPKVVSALALDKEHVRVTFNEAVQLPVVQPETAFSIKNATGDVQLAVQSAVMDATNSSNKAVLLQTVDQQAGASYILTAGIDIKDLAGNPIVSGTSDTAEFTGTDMLPATQQAVTATQQTAATQQAPQGPQLLSVTATDPTHLQVTFDKAVVLKSNPTDNFIITEQQTIENTLNVNAVTLSSDGTAATLTTDPMKGINYNLIVVDVTDTSGTALSSENNATVFMGIAGAAPIVSTQQTTQQLVLDTTPPEDVTNFTAALVKKLIVTLSWTKSLNSAGDLAKYVLYMGTDGKTFGTGINIDPKSANFDVTKIVPGVKYFFKLVAMDASGNASAGVMTTFVLPKTGPELGLLLLGSLGAGKVLKRKKVKKIKK